MGVLKSLYVIQELVRASLLMDHQLDVRNYAVGRIQPPF